MQQRISKNAKNDLLTTKPLRTAHVGISIFEPATERYWFNYQGEKYFVPASNTKIPTCYAAMKYLGDSLVGLRYERAGNLLLIQPSADPSFLHPDFRSQPVFDFLVRQQENQITIVEPLWEAEKYGAGWSWNDYLEPYMVERSAMPLYGNLARFTLRQGRFFCTPAFFTVPHEITDADLTMMVDTLPAGYTVTRDEWQNEFRLKKSPATVEAVSIPFRTGLGISTVLLSDTLKKKVFADVSLRLGKHAAMIYSQPTDSLLRPLMHRSDNFFAEQFLLMVSQDRLGIMSDEKIIDAILKTDLSDLPQKPRWVDGSGLSRYNLFSPMDMVVILEKMRANFGMDRLKAIFPTGGSGTLRNYFTADSNYIYAKTGTLSGVVCLSGFIYTRKGRELIFSVLVNNHQDSANAVRREVEKFLKNLRNRF